MPAEPITWRALEALKARIETISVANGDWQDLSGVSLEGFDLSEPDTHVHIVADDLVPERLYKDAAHLPMPVIIEFYLPPSLESNKAAHRLLHDLLKTLPRKGSELDPDILGVVEVTARRILQPVDGVPYIVGQLAINMPVIDRFT